MSGLEDFARLVDGDHGLCVVSTLRPDEDHRLVGGERGRPAASGDRQPGRRPGQPRRRAAAGAPAGPAAGRGGRRRAGWPWAAVEGPAGWPAPTTENGVDAERLRLLLREIFTTARQRADDFDAYDRVMASERRVAVLVSPARVTPRG